MENYLPKDLINIVDQYVWPDGKKWKYYYTEACLWEFYSLSGRIKLLKDNRSREDIKWVFKNIKRFPKIREARRRCILNKMNGYYDPYDYL